MKITALFLLILLFNTSFAQNNSTTNYNEPYRPQFHFTPESKWMNDPNGLIYFNGKYHLFYQYFPDGIIWGPMHWGHAVSTDLLQWKQLPIALYPDKLGWIFSGSAVIDTTNSAGFGKNAMIAIFTYHNDEIVKSGKKNCESQGIAYSLDEGLTWTKYKENPVLNNSGEQDFRDPKVFWNAAINKWNMVLAVGDKSKIWSSTNLKQWQFESDFKPTNDLELGVWECPDLFSMKTNSGETKWIMIVNHGDKAPNGGSGTRYFVGDFDGKTFKESQKSIWMDNGTDFYAAVTFSNVPDNKRILLGWMSNWQYATKVPTEVWRSAMTMPRELSLAKDKKGYYLNQKLVSQFSTLIKPVFEQANVVTPFEKVNLDLSQTEVTFDLDKTTNFILSLSNSKGEVYTITLSENKLITDRRNSGNINFSETFAPNSQVMNLNDKISSFKLVLDKSSAEILLNDGKYSMTNLFFPTKDFSILNIVSKDNSPITNLKINSISRVWK
ncbi:glycoside hydrolase family 32 protein [Flavobacterium sp. SUN052]|uniref:glycoside hydrolase family 32 protein n=1 Tax=Flavobacterium sp. SUN052 TaxID=3002441 RepID=UPI00237E1A9F|nr:glycoside hydrolase family 32 protein [Flavobacterium sp. SUN052]MEC4005100.1 glycoside hydrolase family 32 protein [Flavobacterium sp. SUN052]